MIGRKAVIGLALLCALLFSAIAVQGASAAAGTNITAFTCVEQKEGNFDFEDAHCDKKTGKGKFSHVAITTGTSTLITATNETTGGATSTQTLAGKPFGVTTNISCTKLGSKEGTVQNSEPSAGVHKLTGKGTFEYTGCTASAPTKCSVKNPILATIGSVESQEGLTGPKGEANAMGLEFKSVEGKPFAEVTLEGAECALKGKPFPVEGSVIVTNGPGTEEAQTNKWSGATGVVTPTESMSKLTSLGKAATYSGTVTYRMEKNGSEPINPISTTTVT